MISMFYCFDVVSEDRGSWNRDGIVIVQDNSFLWQSTMSHAFSASPIAFCALEIMVCLARFVGDVSSFDPESLITV